MATTNQVDGELEALLDDGTLEPVAVIIERISGKRPNPSTVWRWCRKSSGPAGVLPARLLLGTQTSTEKCVRAWLSRRSEYRPRIPVKPSGRGDSDLQKRGLMSR